MVHLFTDFWKDRWMVVLLSKMLVFLRALIFLLRLRIFGILWTLHALYVIICPDKFREQCSLTGLDGFAANVKWSTLLVLFISHTCLAQGSRYLVSEQKESGPIFLKWLRPGNGWFKLISSM